MHQSLPHASGLLQANYRAQGQQALNHQQTAVQQIISQRQLPPHGWTDLQIRSLMNDIAMMDSNNFSDTAGVGEREGRVYSALVRDRHMHLAHGVGRSGDLLAQQPKAVGSSLLHSLTHSLTLHAVKLAGLTEAKQVLLLPLATGMSIMLALTALKHAHPLYMRQQQEAQRYAQAIAQAAMEEAEVGAAASAASSVSAESTVAGESTTSIAAPVPSSCSPLYVLWSRIDQKTCLKSITAAGLVPVAIELVRRGDQLETDVAAMERALQRLGAERVVAVVTTTSCFAPRAPDDVLAVGRLCARLGVAHLVNNAYGIQSARTCKDITTAVRKGARIDALVSSMDKNFMVPVGGAILVSFQAEQAKDKKHKQPQRSSPSLSSKTNGAEPAVAAVPPPSDASAPSASSPPLSSPSLPPPSPPSNLLHLVSSLYPGRASASSLTDLFLTLMSLGASGWRDLLSQREQLMPLLRQRMEALATKHGERMMHTPDNTISMAMTIDGMEEREEEEEGEEAADAMRPEHNGNGAATAAATAANASTAASRQFNPSYLGSLLFSRNVSGPRCLSALHSPASTIGGLRFPHYGTHCGDGVRASPHSYLTAAASIGMREEEVDRFVSRLDKCITEFHKQRNKQRQAKRADGKHGAQATDTQASTSNDRDVAQASEPTIATS